MDGSGESIHATIRRHNSLRWRVGQRFAPFRLLRVAKEPDRLLDRYVLYATWLLRLATATLIRRLV